MPDLRGGVEQRFAAMASSQEFTVSHVHSHALRTGMGLVPMQSPGARVSEAEINHVIARTLSEDRQREARSALPAIASQDELSGNLGRVARRAAQEEIAANARLDAIEAQYELPLRSPVEDLRGKRGRQPAQVAAWLRRGVLVLAAIGVVWTWPWVLPVAVVTAFVAPVCFAFALGSESMAHGLARLFHWLNARRPDRAERMRGRVDWLAMELDRLLDRLPERWTTGLYMPDFSREALLSAGEVGAPDPFDRLRADPYRA